MLRWIAAAAIVLLCSTDAASAQPRVIDGDTLVLNGTTYRLEGIDAPELTQRCGYNWLAGAAAASMLRELTKHGTHCTGSTRDKYGRTVGVCVSSGIDVGMRMIRTGMAFADPRYSQRYVIAEVQAESEGRGVHWYGCAKPWEWRRKHEAANP